LVFFFIIIKIKYKKQALFFFFIALFSSTSKGYMITINYELKRPQFVMNLFLLNMKRSHGNKFFFFRL
jgi:hypothetical protein